ncbi:hypothetical protein I6A84_35690 [Frankia sp. CNm7]|uniref:Xaa-Pro dipeptidase n=1 Tax=Frankia nepalensis TaxID=1836974 RepID=A0A937RJ13_9ACTN|nr:hypothetical protein [Frankia nepalensis]MBL7502757.1 hypothetical protein [Frankia nepalensis]MBL7515495.1 hypothetical protein [Frankia nepalensis]MBL7523286.1 hypothetical protein [Frankia nepalensis]MBL7627263.1 hypothetical protein [Frankia nepalensis]
MAKLPADFADLEPFTDWCLDTEDARFAKRYASNMDEMQAFYDAVFPRIQDALTYLDKFELEELSEDAFNLLLLYYSLCTISFPVEAWRQPRVPDAGAAHISNVLAPAV